MDSRNHASASGGRYLPETYRIMLLRCAVSGGVNARLRYDWRTPIACGWATKMGSHAATASGASTVPCSGTSPARFRATPYRSEEHTSELQSLMRISYAVFCLKKKRTKREIQA